MTVINLYLYLRFFIKLTIHGSVYEVHSVYVEFEEEEFCEDDMFAEYGKKHVPTDAEVQIKIFC